VTNPVSLSAVPEDFANVRLGPGYLITLDVYNVPEMSASLRVDANGDVTVPLIGAVHVAGDTLTEAQRRLEQVLVDSQILNAPHVNLNIVQFAANNVTVLGEVQAPGRIQLLAQKNLGDLLALVGGETAAAGKDIEIQHNASGVIKSRHVDYPPGSSPELLRDVLVYPGDTVFVHRAGVVYVLGAVTRPGGYLMVNGGSLNVLQAIALANGTTLTSADRSIRIIRSQGAEFVEIDIPYKQIARGNTPPTSLQAGDIVYVPNSAMKSALINGSSLIGTAASATIYKVP
jgi:polysaccharide export outer membrane protein